MFIDARSRLILEELALYQGRIAVKDLMKKYGLKNGQVDYSVARINDYLTFQQMNKIIKLDGELIADFNVLEIFSKLKESSKKNYALSERERTQVSLLLLIAKERPLSLQDFIIGLQISKNTALKSMQNVRKVLKKYELSLSYSRQEGYQIKGREATIRTLLQDIVIHIVKNELKMDYVRSLLKIEQELQLVRSKMIELEKRLAIIYTDHRHSIVAFLIAILLRRISAGSIIEEMIPEKKDILDTQEYQEISKIFETFQLPEKEIVYLTMCVLAIDISKVKDSLDTGVPNLRIAINQTIDLFEKKACITFFNREFLIKMLIQHLRPAYYRIKYQLNLSKGFDETLINEATHQEFRNIYQIVHASKEPIEIVFGKKLPETELRLLTLLFAGEMKNRKNKSTRPYRVAVVCTEGISVSSILYLTLSELIPELEFLKPMSLRELHELDESSYDIVIGPFYFETSKKLIIIDPVITQQNRDSIRSKILGPLYGITSNPLNIEGMMEIIRGHAQIEDEQKLLENLTNYIYTKTTKKEADKLTPATNISLVELLKPERIIKVDSVNNWKEALQIVAAPLIYEQVIDSRYIEKIIEKYTVSIPHIIFGKEIAVPHINEEKLVHMLGMSMLILKQGVTFKKNENVHIVILLATPDKQSHLTAMIQLLEFSACDEDVAALINCLEVDDMRNILQKYC